jgi:hypothetical protein
MSAAYLKMVFAPAEVGEAIEDYLMKKAPGLMEGRRVSRITERSTSGDDGGFHVTLEERKESHDA